MATTLPAILEAPNLLGIVETVKPGLPTVHLPPGLVNAPARPVDGNVFTYYTNEGTQKTMRQSAYGSASRGSTMTSLGEKPGKTIWGAENYDIKASSLMNLMSPESTGSTINKQKMGEVEIARLVRESVVRRQNLRTAALTSLFGLGHIYFGAEGDLLPSSSNAVVDIDAGIPANNLNQLNGIIGTTWATDTVDILGDLQAIHSAAVRTSGIPLKHAIYGANVFEYLMSNTIIQNLVYRNAAANSAALNAMVFTVGGLTWWPGYFAFFEDQNGTDQTQIGGDTVIFLPEPDSSWFELIEGTTPVASGVQGATASMEALFASISAQQGMWQYATLQTDPVGGKLVFGDNFMPVIRNPNAVFIADVVP